MGTVAIGESEYARLLELEEAVKRVVTQRADDLCWRDVYTELAALVGIQFCPQLEVTSERFLANCRRFDDSLRGGPPYVKPTEV